MPALGIVLAVLALAAFLWHLRMLHSTNTDASLTLAHAGRHGPPSVLEDIEDPVLAEAIFLVALAQDSTDDPAEIRQRVARQIAAVAPGARDELLAYAQWIGRSVPNAKDAIRRFKSIWLNRLSGPQRARLIAMAEDVARDGGVIASPQKITLAALRLSLA